MAWQAQGFKAWLLQRLTAVYIGFYIIVFGVGLMAYADTISYQYWKQLISHPYINISLTMFFYAILFHAWVGIRDVIMDYVKPVSFRLILLTFIAVGLFIMAIWVSLILITVLQI